jgi:hypothetical protein
MNTEENNNIDYKIDISSPPCIKNKIREAQKYRENILTKTREAQERVDRFTIMMYQRFINETEDW